MFAIINDLQNCRIFAPKHLKIVPVDSSNQMRNNLSRGNICGTKRYP